MVQSPSQVPLTTWQFFSSCRRILGDAWLQGLFKRGVRQLQRWSTDPDFAEADRNPMDHYEAVLRRLMEMGRGDVARASVTRQAQIVECELRCLDKTIPDRSTLAEEMMDDHAPLVAFHEAVRNLEDLVVVHDLFQKARREIEGTYMLYAQTYERGR